MPCYPFDRISRNFPVILYTFFVFPAWLHVQPITIFHYCIATNFGHKSWGHVPQNGNICMMFRHVCSQTTRSRLATASERGCGIWTGPSISWERSCRYASHQERNCQRSSPSGEKMLKSTLSESPRATDHRPQRDPSRGWACLARCGKLLAIHGTTGLLSLRATDSSGTANSLKTLSISNSVYERGHCAHAHLIPSMDHLLVCG